MARRADSDEEPADDEVFFDDDSAEDHEHPDGPGEFDQHLLDEDEKSEDTVPCPKCGRVIWAHAPRCHKCGVEFASEAWLEQAEGEPARAPSWIVVGAVAVLLAIVISIYIFGRWHTFGP